jgi:PKD domain/L,D-transpeptidase catalytic domain/Putative peptidoglycan binding domain
VRRVLPVLLFLIWVAPANAAPVVSVQANPTNGPAPLDVTLTATGNAVSYHWDLGDGSQADGPVVQHRYGVGRHTATVTAAAADGSTAQASVTITAARLSLIGTGVVTYGRRATFKGRLAPAIPGARIVLSAAGAPVSSGSVDKAGRFRFRLRLTTPAILTAAFENVVSNPVAVRLRPALDVALPSSRMLGRRLVFRAALRPSRSGTLKVRIWRNGHELRPRAFGDHARLRLSTNRVGSYVVRVTVIPAELFRGRRVTARSNVYVPYLSAGAHGPSVRILERRLAELRFALRGVDGFYAYDTSDAVLAFQKVQGLVRTGRVSPLVWRRLFSAHVPVPRYRLGRHIEVDKRRQVLLEVNGGRVVRVVHVSTGATGNTPVGRWHVYSKVPGFLPSGMYYSSFFVGAFAIHGYPSVPAYPASHGCVRIPRWIAPTIFASDTYGETVHVY